MNHVVYKFVLSDRLKVLALLCFPGIAVFFATMHSPFLYDDAHAIQDNPYIKNLSEFQQTVGIQNIFNRSVLLLTFSINYALGQSEVFGYHLFNIFLHVCVGIVLYFLIAELLTLEQPSLKPQLKKLPLVASLVHLFNPVTVESVTYISSRSSVLATLFYVLSFYFLVRFSKTKEKRGDGPSLIHYPVLAFLLFLFGLGAKEIIITLPIIAVLYLWVQSPTKSFRKFFPDLAAILIPLLGYLLYRYVEMGSLLVIKTDPYSHLVDRGLYFLTQIKVVISYYFLKLLFPINLNFEPDIRLVSGLTDWEWIAALMAMTSIACAVFYQKSVLLKGAFFWALLTVLPTSSIIPLKQFAIEHRTYLPGIGISVGMGILLLRAVPLVSQARHALLILMVLYGFLTMQRSLDYRTEVVLWEDTVNKSPYKSMAHNNLGTAYLFEDRLDEARKSFEISLALSPSSTDPYINLGHIHLRNKEWDKARIKFDLALKLGASRSQVFFNSGLMRLRLNQPEEALPFLLKAIEIKSHRALYHYELGNAFRKLKQHDSALKAYRRALELEPSYVEAQNNIGVIFWNLKVLDKAEIEFKKALQMSDGKVTIHSNLANLYIAQKRFSQAIPHLKSVTSQRPDDLRAKNLLHIAEVLQQTKAQ
jgi:Flp pilus assembly protein TadD